MVEASLVGVALAGFGLGLLHAMDADHVLAVTGMSSRRPGLRTALAYAGHWGLGHGLTLLCVGAGVFMFGTAIPEGMSQMAEGVVGLVLMAIAAGVLWDIWRGGGAPASGPSAARTGPGALLVGVVHGMAGSAPLLAVVPLMAIDTPWVALGYLLVFGLGVVLAMLSLGGILGTFLDWLNGGRALTRVRLLVAGLGLAVGFRFVTVSLA